MLELITPVRVEGAISDEWLDRLNMHASLSARIATRLVRRDESADAFCAAIVAECGQLVFATCRPAAFARTINSRQRRDGVVTDAEHTEFGVSHAQAGAYLLSLWGFPTSVVEAVATHDRMPGAELSVPMSVPDAVRVAREIADRHIQRICSARATQDGDRQITFDGWLDDPDLLTADWSLDNDARPLRFAATTTPVPPLGQPGDDHGKVGVGT
jgi:hypothetical protein